MFRQVTASCFSNKYYVTCYRVEREREREREREGEREVRWDTGQQSRYHFIAKKLSISKGGKGNKLSHPRKMRLWGPYFPEIRKYGGPQTASSKVRPEVRTEATHAPPHIPCNIFTISSSWIGRVPLFINASK